MGFNPKYRQWTTSNWQGYAPTIDHMARHGWTLTFHCRRCRFASQADIAKIIRLKGKAYSPWGKTAKCPALYCGGRMTLSAHDPRSNERINI